MFSNTGYAYKLQYMEPLDGSGIFLIYKAGPEMYIAHHLFAIYYRSQNSLAEKFIV